MSAAGDRSACVCELALRLLARLSSSDTPLIVAFKKEHRIGEGKRGGIIYGDYTHTYTVRLCYIQTMFLRPEEGHRVTPRAQVAMASMLVMVIVTLFFCSLLARVARVAACQAVAAAAAAAAAELNTPLSHFHSLRA